MTDFHLSPYLTGSPDVLTSQAYFEGFGQGAYSRLDTKFYQGLTTSIVQDEAAGRAAPL